jgi:tetratricopeptide (TPR) repeat protein
MIHGDFDAPAAEAVVGTPEALDRVQLLVDRSLIQRTGEGTRFRLLRAVREFAGSALLASGDALEVRDRHTRWAAAASSRAAAEVDGPFPAVGLAWLRSNRHHLLAAASRAGLDDPAVDAIATGLGALMLREGPLGQLRDALSDATAPAAIRIGARAAALTGRPEQAAARLTELLASDPEARSSVLAALSETAAIRGRIREARDRAREAHAASTGPRDRARTAFALARLHWTRGRREEAVDLARQALGDARDADARLLRAEIGAWLGGMELRAGRIRDALELLEPAADLFAQVGDVRAHGAVLRSLARAATAQGDPDAAGGFLDAAAALASQIGDAGSEAVVHLQQAAGLIGQDRLDDAADTLRAAADAADRARGGTLRWRIAADQGLVAWAKGRLADARDRFAYATRIADGSEDSAGQGEARELAAALAHVQGRGEEARRLLTEAATVTAGTTRASVAARRIVLGAFLTGAAAELVEAHALAPRDFGDVGRTGAVADHRLHLILGRFRAEVSAEGWYAAWAEMLDPRTQRLLVAAGGERFRVPGGGWRVLGTGSQQARLLGALARRTALEPGAVAATDEVRKALWPGESMGYQSALDRVHQAVRRLRKAGMGDLIERRPDGYVLSVEVALVPGL